MPTTFWNDAHMLKLCPWLLLGDLSSMYKDFKSLKDIYKDKCNLHVTIHNVEKLRDQRVSV